MAEVTVESLSAGVPIEVLAADLQGLEKGTQCVVLETSKHFRPNAMFLRVSREKARHFESTCIAVDKKASFKSLDGDDAEKLLKKERKWQSSHIVEALTGTAWHNSVGCDPEIFVVDENDVLIPAFDFLPDKTKPKRGNNSTAYWDGFQAEFTATPAGCLAYHVDYVREGLKLIHDAAVKYNPKAKLSLASVIEVPDATLKTCKPEHAALGCDPSKNIYGAAGIGIDDGRLLPVRFAGGHIHLGIGATSQEETERIIKACDAIIGVACVSLYADLDAPMRRQYYGLAGEYRTPAHGLEYRTLSNACLSHPVINHLVFDTAREAGKFGKARLGRLLEGSEEDRVQDIINNCDVKAARKYLKANEVIYTKLLEQCYRRTVAEEPSKMAGEQGYLTFLNGIDYAVKDPMDIVGNWSLTGKWTPHSGGSEGASGAQWNNAAKKLSSGKKV
jgi:hypothetical protein